MPSTSAHSTPGMCRPVNGGGNGLDTHLDGAHLAANLAAGVWFCYLAAAQIGSGSAWLLIVTGAACANLLEALLGPSTHLSVGASTAMVAPRSGPAGGTLPGRCGLFLYAALGRALVTAGRVAWCCWDGLVPAAAARIPRRRRRSTSSRTRWVCRRLFCIFGALAAQASARSERSLACRSGFRCGARLASIALRRGDARSPADSPLRLQRYQASGPEAANCSSRMLRRRNSCPRCRQQAWRSLPATPRVAIELTAATLK